MGYRGKSRSAHYHAHRKGLDFAATGWTFDHQRIKRAIQRHLVGHNYFGMIELAVYTNVLQGNSRRISPHFQGFIWGPYLSGLPRIRNDLFSGGDGGAVGAKLMRITNFEGAARYIFKPPSHGYRRIASPSSGFIHRLTDLTLRQHHSLFTHLHALEFFDLMISGGDGVKIARSMRAEAARAIS